MFDSLVEDIHKFDIHSNHFCSHVYTVENLGSSLLDREDRFLFHFDRILHGTPHNNLKHILSLVGIGLLLLYKDPSRMSQAYFHPGMYYSVVVVEDNHTSCIHSNHF